MLLNNMSDWPLNRPFSSTMNLYINSFSSSNKLQVSRSWRRRQNSLPFGCRWLSHVVNRQPPFSRTRCAARLLNWLTSKKQPYPRLTDRRGSWFPTDRSLLSTLSWFPAPSFQCPVGADKSRTESVRREYRLISSSFVFDQRRPINTDWGRQWRI